MAFTLLIALMVCGTVHATRRKSKTTCPVQCTVDFQDHSGRTYHQTYSSYEIMTMTMANDVTSLTMTNRCKVQELEENTLQRFSQLQVLTLKLCDVHVDINGSVFNGLFSLRELTLDFVPSQAWYILVTIHTPAFKPIPNLKKLYIYPHNKEVAPELRALQEIHIEDILLLLPDLEHLTLSGYRLGGSITLNDNVTLPNLHSLEYSSNHWTSIPCLSSLSNLRLLNLSNNAIRHLRIWPGCFQTTNLSIDLSNNLILYLEKDDFSSYAMTELSLDLSENYVYQLKKDAFEHLAKRNTTIRQLVIAREIKHMQYEAQFFQTLFDCISKITIYQLVLLGTDVSLTAKDFSFLNSTSLQKFSVEKGKIKDLPKNGLNGLKNLKFLEITYSHIGKVDKNAFDALDKLETLVLTGNSVQSSTSLYNILENINRLESVSTLLLNKLGKWYETSNAYKLNNVKTLKHVDVSDTTLMTVFTLILRNLEILRANDLSCQIHPSKSRYCIHVSLPRRMRILEMQNCKPCVEVLSVRMAEKMDLDFPALTTLKAGNNYGLSFDKGPLNKMQMPNLKLLTLSNNRIQNLNEQTFLNFSKLEYLDLSYNSLQTIGKYVFSRLTLLKQLLLHNNLIHTFDESNCKGLKHLKLISLQNNKFDCNCELREFRDWLNNKSNNLREKLLDNCSYPATLKETNIAGFNLPWIECDGHIYVIIVLSSAGLVLLITPVLVLAHYRLDIKYWYYFKYKFRKCPVRETYEYDAMVCYNIDDVKWVKDNMMPELEEGNDCQFKLCIHHRDFRAGEWIRENIINSMNHSRSIIFVMTRKFMNSEWGEFELEMALMRLLEVKRQFIVMVMLEKIPKKELKSKLKCFMRHVTYVEWPTGEGYGVRERERFWKILKLALLDHKQATVVDCHTPLLAE